MNKIACTGILALTLTGLGLVSATAANANEVPDSTDDAYSMTQGDTLTVDAVSGLLANDVATGPTPLAVVEWFATLPNDVTVNPDGSFSFTPLPDFSGVATFQYKAGAGNWWGYARTVSITVNPLPAKPSVTPDAYSTPQDTVLTIDAASGLLVNDEFPTGAVVDIDDASGEIVAQLDGSFVYTPQAGFTGLKEFAYRMSNGVTVSDWAYVGITVTAPAVVIGTPPVVTPPIVVPPVVVPPVDATPVDAVPSESSTDTDELPTLAYTGTNDVTSWLIAPALGALALGGLGLWVARRRSQFSQ